MTTFLEEDFYSFDDTQGQSLVDAATGMLRGDHTQVSAAVDVLTGLDQEIVTEGLHVLLLELLAAQGITTDSSSDVIDALSSKVFAAFDTSLFAPASDDTARLLKSLLGLSDETHEQLGFTHVSKLYLTLAVMAGCARETALCTGNPVDVVILEAVSTLTWYC